MVVYMVKNDRQPQSAHQRILISKVPNTRRGKHHQLVKGILRDLEVLPEGSALKISLADLEEVTLNNLRSAVNRATSSRGLRVETRSDENYFYIWPKPRT